MEAGKAIRFVAAFVVGIVLVMGGAMIYSMVLQLHHQQAANAQKPPKPQQGIGATTTLPANISQGAVPSPSVVQIPAPSNSPPSVAYVRLPDPQIVREPALQPHKTAAPVTAPAGTLAKMSNPASGTVASNLSGSNLPPAEAPPLARPEGVRPEGSESAEPAAPQPRISQPHTVTLWTGTPITIKLTEPLSTEQSKPGEYFPATLEAPIIQDGFIIADSGSGVTGEVARSKRGGIFGRAPDLTLVLSAIRTTDNQVVRIQTSPWTEVGRSHNLVSGTFRSAVGAVSGALAGAARGSGLISEPNGELGVGKDRNVTLPTNSILQFRLSAPVSITEHTH